MDKPTTPKLFSGFENIKKPSDQMYAGCLNGHSHHGTMTVDVELNGGYHEMYDVPSVPAHLANPIKMEVYAWPEYFQFKNGALTNRYKTYCPGQDIISQAIAEQGVWEAHETLLVLDILKRDNQGVVLDFGSHIGWYSTLAATNGYRVAALDANAENLSIVKRNTALNGIESNVSRYLSWLDEDVPVLSDKVEPVHLLKADVEGAESHVLTMSRSLFKASKITYALFEISPVFDSYYPDLVEEIAGYGYDVYQLPGKGWEHNDEYSNAPLETLKKYCEVKSEGRRSYVKSLHQENFLFIRKGNV